MLKIQLIPIGPAGDPARPLGELPGMARENCEGTASFYKVVGFEPPWIGVAEAAP